MTAQDACLNPAHSADPRGVCAGCWKELDAELTALRDRYMRLLAEADEDHRKAREAAARGDIVPLPHNRRNGTEATPVGFEAVMSTAVLKIGGRTRPKKGRYSPSSGDEIVLSVGHRTTGDPRSILLERSQAEALHAWLGEWIRNGWPGVDRKCGRHYRDRLGEWQCGLDPGHDGDHEGAATGWRTGTRPAPRTWSNARRTGDCTDARDAIAMVTANPPVPCWLCGVPVRHVPNTAADEWDWADSTGSTTGRNPGLAHWCDPDLNPLGADSPYDALARMAERMNSSSGTDWELAGAYSMLKIRLDAGGTFHVHTGDTGTGNGRSFGITGPECCGWPAWLRPSGWHCRQCGQLLQAT